MLFLKWSHQSAHTVNNNNNIRPQNTRFIDAIPSILALCHQNRHSMSFFNFTILMNTAVHILLKGNLRKKSSVSWPWSTMRNKISALPKNRLELNVNIHEWMNESSKSYCKVSVAIQFKLKYLDMQCHLYFRHEKTWTNF